MGDWRVTPREWQDLGTWEGRALLDTGPEMHGAREVGPTQWESGFEGPTEQRASQACQTPSLTADPDSHRRRLWLI